MVDYIGSNAIKKYYKENGITLSDRMTAARICNAGFNVEEIHNSLMEIQAYTKDADLKAQIGKYIRREVDMYEKLKKSVQGDIYELSVWHNGDSEYSGEYYFSDFEPAFLMMQEMKEMKEAEGYKIKKFRIMDKSQLPFEEKEWGMRNAEGYAEYNSSGELSNIWAETEGCERTFEDEYFYYPHPFKKGDILVIPGDEEMLYIMDISPDEEEARKKRIAPWADNSDIGIICTMINRRTGRIWDMDEWVNPLDFEYAVIDENTEDVIERAALEMQRIMQGKAGSFQYIFDACARRQEEYLESTRISLITGIQLHPHNVFF